MSGENPIACSLSEPAKAGSLAALEAEIFAAAVETRELADGYEFRFPGDGDWLIRLASFVVDERQCCPFFTFEIVCEPGEGPTWVRLRGCEGVKEFISDQFLQAS